ncbi:MAG: tripartite tricarboxylate transporter TctB family protein [Alphaproteobacteria bacterium]
MNNLFERLVSPAHRGTIAFAFAILAFMFYFIFESYAYKPAIRVFPLLIGFSGVVLCILDIFSNTNTALGRIINTVFGTELAKPDHHEPPKLIKELTIFAWMSGLVLGIYVFGFLVMTIVFVFAWMWIQGGRTIKSSLYTSIATFGFIYVLFSVILRYELFIGVVFEYLLDL